MGNYLFEMGMAIIGVALVALLVNRNANTAQVIGAGGSVFNQLLQTVTLQGSGGLMARRY